MNRIKELRKANRMTQQELADILGFNSPSQVYFLESGMREPPIKIVNTLCDYFKVSSDYLLGRTEVNECFQNKNNGLKFDNSLVGLNPIPLTQKVPIYGSVSAGYPMFSEENLEGYTYLPDIENTSDIFCLRVDGNSMNLAGIPDKSLAVVHKQSIVENNEIAVARVNEDETLIKRFFREENIIHLKPESSDTQFKELTFDLMKTSIYIIGKVVGCVIKF